MLQEDLGDLGAKALDRDELARRLRYNSGAGGLAARKIGALVHYGFLERKATDLYGLTVSGSRLQATQATDREFLPAIRTALSRPALFSRILERYKSQGRLPADLPRILTEQFGITPKASSDAADIFVRSAWFARVLSFDGRFCIEEDAKGVDPTSSRQASGDSHHRLPIDLVNQRTAWLEIPPDITGSDCLLVQKQLRLKTKNLSALLGVGEPSSDREDKIFALTIPLSHRRVVGLAVPKEVSSRDCEILKDQLELWCEDLPLLLGLESPEVSESSLPTAPEAVETQHKLPASGASASKSRHLRSV